MKIIFKEVKITYGNTVELRRIYKLKTFEQNLKALIETF